MANAFNQTITSYATLNLRQPCIFNNCYFLKEWTKYMSYLGLLNYSMKQLGFLLLVMHLLSTAYAQPATPVKIIDNYQGITSISQLLSSFKGKPVFVDMWAT